MKREYPDLYVVLSAYYRQDTATRQHLQQQSASELK